MIIQNNANYKLLNNELANNLYKYLLIFFTIIFSRDTLITSLKLGFYKSFFLYIITIIITIILFLVTNKKKIKISLEVTKQFGLFIGLIIVTSLIKFDFQLYMISIIFYIMVAYLFTYVFSFNDFFRKFSNIMVFLAFFSLISCYLIRPIIFPNGAINANIPIVINAARLKFFDFKLSYVVALPYYIRNFGIFREPGVYQFFLLVPLIYDLLLEKEKIRYFNIIVLSITIISTFSLTGVTVLGLIFITFIVKLLLDKKFTKKSFIILFSVCIVMTLSLLTLYVANDNFSSIINESIKKAVTVNDSTYTRLGSIVNNVKLFMKSPVWGNDFALVNDSIIYNTNSTMSIFAIFGLIPGILYLYYQYIFCTKVSKKKTVQILVFISLTLLVNTQFLLGNSMFWIITFSIFMISEYDLNNDECDYIGLIKNNLNLVKNKLTRNKKLN